MYPAPPSNRLRRSSPSRGSTPEFLQDLHIVDRPTILLRYPSYLRGKLFFRKRPLRLLATICNLLPCQTDDQMFLQQRSSELAMLPRLRPSADTVPIFEMPE